MKTSPNTKRGSATPYSAEGLKARHVLGLLLSPRRSIFLKVTGLLMLSYFNQGSVTAQVKDISGTVVNEAGQKLEGATITVKSLGKTTVTAKDGSFKLSIPSDADSLVFSYIGYEQAIVPVVQGPSLITLHQKAGGLNEVVVIGYGSTKKKDLTGSISTVTSKDFQKGLISSPEQLMVGKVAGVQVTTSGGAPGSGSSIRIRGGTSLNASNDPLIVIDGVPVDNNGILGGANALSLINPNEIESINILKDASASAIYGSRASNGVIIITTKKGKTGGKLNVNFNSSNSLAAKVKNVDVLSADEFRTLVKSSTYIGDAQKAMLGTANTNWQDHIYRTAFSSDNNISLSGGIKALPYRFTYGYMDQNGILKKSSFRRNSLSLNLSPKFFGNHLSINANGKYSNVKNNFSNTSAISAAVYFDPTQPVYSGRPEFGGLYEYLAGGVLNALGARNPVGLINDVDNINTINRFIGNAQLDYSFHFLPALHANLNLAIDNSSSNGSFYAPATSAAYFYNRKSGGINNQYKQNKKNKLLEFYLNYGIDLAAIRSHFDILGGYSYQDWISRTPAFADLSANKADTIAVPGIPGFAQNTLISFYSRLNYSLMDKYLVTVTLRRDGSSRFSPQSRWGNFPSAALAWKIKNEPFLKNVNFFSDVKLRLGWGITGQQDGIADFSYQQVYQYSDSGAQYRFGNAYIPLARPQSFDGNLKWEQTTTKNAGLDIAILNNRVNLTVDYYVKSTKDLLAVVPISAGTNFINQLLTNVGSIKNRGLEVTVNTDVIKTKNFNLSLAANFTNILQNEIERLQLVNDPSFTGTDVGFINFSFIQRNSIGYRPSTFFMYKQLSDVKGQPVEGSYLDRNSDGKINNDDKFWMQSPDPKYYYGFSAASSYKKWSAGFALHGSSGNYLYNGVNALGANLNSVKGTGSALNNSTTDILTTGFKTNQPWSDHFLENASFLRLDNVNVSYSVGKILKGAAGLRFSATCQNVFWITKYSGLDPEQTNGGIDLTIYPRPRTYILGVNLDF